VLSPLPLIDPHMKQRQVHEQKYLREIKETQATRLAIIPWQIEPPIGLKELRKLTHHSLATSLSSKSI
jgi:arsenite-transporting ATPase